jgi:hypothetical protein
MKIIQSFSFAIVVAIFSTTTASAQQGFNLSSKFSEIEFRGQTFWNGQHRFGDVFCLNFPDANNAVALAEAMYNNNALYFSRAAYNNMTALYVVSSTVPAGRSVEEEIGNLQRNHQRFVSAYPRNFSQTSKNGVLGPSLVLTIRNSKEGEKNAPFPFARRIDARANAPLTSISVHRLFVHRSDRIEVAGLRYFAEPVSENLEGQVISELTNLVEQAADSLQLCTSKLPLREQK